MKDYNFKVTLHQYLVEGVLEVDIAGFPEGQIPSQIIASLLEQEREIRSAEAELSPRQMHAMSVDVGESAKHASSEDPTSAGPTQARARLSIAELPVGQYTVRVVTKNQSEQTGCQEAPFEMPEVPYWTIDPVGLEPALPIGFAPVCTDGSQVKVWGREYRLEGGPLLSYIRAQGAEILASPVTMRAKWAGQEAVFAGQSAALQETKPERVTFQGSATAGPWRLDGKVGVEFDGLALSDLTISGPADIALDELALDIPIKPEHARYFHYIPGQWGTTRNAGALPETGWQSVFKPLVWLGDEERGLCWFAETDEFWRPTGNEQAIQIIKEDEQVILRLNIITRPTRLSKPVVFTFGFQATPVKEIVKDAWDYRITHVPDLTIPLQPLHERVPQDAKSRCVCPLCNCTFPPVDEQAAVSLQTKLNRMAELGVRNIAIHEIWTDIHNYPYPAPHEDRILRQLVQASREKNIGILLYFGYMMSDIAPEFPDYADECLVMPNGGAFLREPEQKAYVVCYGSHWADFLAVGMAHLMNTYDIDGFYLDGVFDAWMGGCTNAHHGCGYVAEDGTRRPTWPYLASRHLMHRIWNSVKSRKPEGLVNIHNSTEMLPPSFTYATSSWDGEQISGIDAGPDIFELLPLDTFRAEFIGRQWGVPSEFLCYGRPYTYEQAISFTLLHDVPIRGVDFNSLARESSLWRAMDEFGRKEAEWLPYWSNQDVAQVSPKGCYVSMYNRGETGVLLVVSNLSKDTADVQVTLQTTTLGLPKETVARDMLSGELISWDGASVKCSLPSLGFRVVRVATE